MEETNNPTTPPTNEPAPESGNPPPSPESGEPQRPKSIVTEGIEKPEGDQPKPKEDGQDQKDKDDSGDKALAVPEKPDGYEATFPEGTEVDQELLTAYRSKAHELGLNQKQFQELAGLYAEKMAGEKDRFRKAQFDSVDQAGLKWAEELKARPTYAADLNHAQRCLAQFGSQELYEYFDVSMAGNYPPMFDFVVNVGKALSEPEFRGRGGSSAGTSAADVLYPNQGK